MKVSHAPPVTPNWWAHAQDELVNAFVGVAGLGSTRSLSALLCAYERHTGTTLAPSSFHARFTPQLAKLFEDLLFGLMPFAHAQGLGAFHDILALDSILVRLWQGLAPQWPSSNSCIAGAKLQVLLKIGRMTPKEVSSILSNKDRHMVDIYESNAISKYYAYTSGLRPIVRIKMDVNLSKSYMHNAAKLLVGNKLASDEFNVLMSEEISHGKIKKSQLSK